MWLLLGTFAVVGLSKRELDGTDLLTFCGLAYLALLARRNYGPFALAAVPILVRHLSCVLEDWRGQNLGAFFKREARLITSPPLPTGLEPEYSSPPLWQRILNLSIAALLGLVIMLKLVVVTHPALVGSYLEQQFPVQAVAWLAENQPAGRLLNEYNWGGYLQWSLPGSPVFVDGRTDLFGDKVIGDWMTLVGAGPGWQEQLTRYPIDLVLLEPSRPLFLPYKHRAGSVSMQINRR